jgi:hypothetical protein
VQGGREQPDNGSSKRLALPHAKSFLRRASSPARPLPDFVILGAQRSGTTSLANWLWQHPLVRRPQLSEVHYFDLHYDRSLWWYRAQFPLWRPGGRTGETSPYMLYHPLAPKRAASDLPERTRFIVLLRDPVERAISHYWHCRRMDIEPLSFADAIEAEPQRLASEAEAFERDGSGFHHRHHSYVSKGEYAGQLRRWFDAVGRDRVLVLETEELFGGDGGGPQVLEWLGLPPRAEPLPAQNAAPRLESEDEEVILELRERFSPSNTDLEALLGKSLWG